MDLVDCEPAPDDGHKRPLGPFKVEEVRGLLSNVGLFDDHHLYHRDEEVQDAAVCQLGKDALHGLEEDGGVLLPITITSTINSSSNYYCYYYYY